jgi:hypothetical protein
MLIEESFPPEAKEVSFLVDKGPLTISDAHGRMVVQETHIAGQGIRVETIIGVKTDDLRGSGE